MSDINDPLLDIEPRLVTRYLKHIGWDVEAYPNNIQRVFLQEDAEKGQVEIFFSTAANATQKRKEVFFALNTLSDLYEKTIASIRSDIRSLAFDILASKIPNEYVSNDSIQLRIAHQYINRMKDFLASSATTEISGERSFKRTKKEAIDYSERCRFGHTFRSSFGFTIESPVGLNDAPTMPIIEEPLPLGRRVVERIARGLSSYETAVVEQNPSLIVDNAGGFSANMCDAMADIIEETEVSRISIDIKLSPEWRSTQGILQTMSFAIEHKNLEVLRDAAKAMRREEEPRLVTIFGRIKRLETDGNPADLLENASREIEVNWSNEDNAIIHVRVTLAADVYLNAVEAHKAGNPVSVAGLLVRSGRSWRLERIDNFRVIQL